MRVLTEQANSWNSAVSVSVSTALSPSSSAPPDFAAGSPSRAEAPQGEDDEEGALPDDSDAVADEEEDDEEEDTEAGVAQNTAQSTTQGAAQGTTQAVSHPDPPNGVSEPPPPYTVRRGRRSSGEQWSSTSWRSGSRDHYYQCLVPYIKAPNADDGYYLAALQNAHSTLIEYAQFIGVDGSDFLKHLFSYYILGPRFTGELLARLSNEDRRKHPSIFGEDGGPTKKRRLRARRSDVDTDPVPSTLARDKELARAFSLDKEAFTVKGGKRGAASVPSGLPNLPSVGVPGVPSVSVPSVPSVSVPSVGVPAVGMPSVGVSSVSMSNVGMPGVGLSRGGMIGFGVPRIPPAPSGLPNVPIRPPSDAPPIEKPNDTAVGAAWDDRDDDADRLSDITDKESSNGVKSALSDLSSSDEEDKKHRGRSYV
eukprot:Blabericola_migrator_1__11924@NODE_728_length_6712_cov_159_960873_g524_i0_p2_GENE_NODE_728_length_6712_cov_159_960873_g524_i0NODE_728_length_6712_cov_159_960873_g524_i0_p2_ORF_typecomplete_len423_score59_45_NODE_728_length_6712_cov_159_960873_g524_i029714239